MVKLILKSPYIKNTGNAGGYLKYIGTRPRAERFGSHGLFGDEDNVDMAKAMSELESYRGNVWTHIISLRREDAERLGYNNASAWKNLIRTHRNEIAAAMKIPVGDFRWYAAFHDEGHHPHIHMMAWSAKAGQAYLSKDGIEMIKSKLTNDIFREEMLHLYEQKTVARDELVQEARSAMLELVQKMRDGLCSQPKAELLIWELSMKLETVPGKKSYGYLPKSVKKLVDSVVDEMERLPIVRECYERWLELQGKVQSYYTEEEIKRFKLSQQKEFRQIKNTVIDEALKLGALTFEDGDIRRHDEPDPEEDVTWAYWALKEIIRDRRAELSEKDAAVTEMLKLAESGDVHAQYFMGKLYRDGDPVLPNSQAAEYWFEAAAKQGLDIAQYLLGKLCLEGKGIEHNRENAAYWFTQAAELGHDYAQVMLDRMEEMKPPSVLLSSTRLFHHMSRIFQDNSLPKKSPAGMQTDKKLRRKLQSKRIAMGHKEDDHPDNGPTMTM